MKPNADALNETTQLDCYGVGKFTYEKLLIQFLDELRKTYDKLVEICLTVSYRHHDSPTMQ